MTYEENIITVSEIKRSNEYVQLIEELKKSITSAVNIALKLYEQGKKDGLSNDTIRKDIELALEGVVKDRQLRNILPPELKRKYTNAILPDSAIIAECDTPGWDHGVVETDDFKLMDVTTLEPSKFVSREQIEDEKDPQFIEFYRSIVDNGLIIPITVTEVGEEKYEVVMGTRRLHALKFLGIRKTPVIIKKMDEINVRIASLSSNIHFLPLNEDEIQDAIRAYVKSKTGYSKNMDDVISEQAIVIKNLKSENEILQRRITQSKSREAELRKQGH